MGLDSSLYRIGKTAKAKILTGLSDSGAEYGREELAYWRKNWEIHGLFALYRADGEDDNCTEIFITKENLSEILKQIDEEDEYSIEVVKKVIEETDFEQEEIVYYAWY
jgi:hypothetical protein